MSQPCRFLMLMIPMVLVGLLLPSCTKNTKPAGDEPADSTEVHRRCMRCEMQPIFDYQYVRDRFFFLDDSTRDAYPGDVDAQVVQIRLGSVQLFYDDGDGLTLEGEGPIVPGFAVRDLRSATRTPADSVHTDSLYFVELENERDYWIHIDERIGSETESHPFLVLDRYLDSHGTLAVVYYDERSDEWVGGYDEEAGLLRAQMIRAPSTLLEDDLNEGAWANTNRLMLKNIYSVHGTAVDWGAQGEILEDDFELSIHYWGTLGDAENPDEIENIKLIRYTGLDYFTTTEVGLEEGQDGRVDVRPWVDLENGYIYFPDLQPFAPRAGSYDLRGRPGHPETWDLLPEEYWNEGIYSQRSCVRDQRPLREFDNWESRYFINVTYKTLRSN